VAKTNPDIILVLEESTFDPSNFTGCTIPQCHVGMFQPDQYTRAHGPLRTHTFGGGTWVSEFAVLSGMPQNIFGPAGMYAPYVLAPRLRDSLPMQLRRDGYLTIAVYPVGGSFINARNAYRAYGFDKFYDVNDLGLQMWHTSDSQLFAAARKVYDENRKLGKPIFIMVLTMEQHGPHDTLPLTRLPAPFDKGLMPDLSASQQLNLSTYLSRLQDSNEGMTQLESYFLHRPEPTVVVHFGDHQPSFGGLIHDMPRTLPAELAPYKDNLTYFMLKTNFATSRLPAPPMLDIAYLPSMVLQAASLRQDPYFSALRGLETRCNGLYGDCPDKGMLASFYAWIFDHLHVYE
jgi:phosphoglycerol transferase MdoB-like AlkP superfamily enzyme